MTEVLRFSCQLTLTSDEVFLSRGRGRMKWGVGYLSYQLEDLLRHSKVSVRLELKLSSITGYSSVENRVDGCEVDLSRRLFGVIHDSFEPGECSLRDPDPGNNNIKT